MKTVCTQRFHKPWLFTVGESYEVVKFVDTPQGKLLTIIDNFGDKTDIHEKYFDFK